jgi:N6-adenosine-specific RNA methylase IME4
MKYQIIYADPPWQFNNKNTGGSMKSGASAKYKTTKLDEMKKLDVNSIAADNSVLFMWWVASQPEEAIELVKAWGFELKTMTGFNWIKYSMSKSRNKVINSIINTCKRMAFKNTHLKMVIQALELLRMKLVFGMGFWTRAGSECCLIATKGKPKRLSGSVRSVVLAELREHSEKPSEVRKRIIKLCGDVPRIELYAREKLEGFDVWGDEVECDVKILQKNEKTQHLL